MRGSAGSEYAPAIARRPQADDATSIRKRMSKRSGIASLRSQ
jgi:hypothetical protein